MTKLQLIDYIRTSTKYTAAQKSDMIHILKCGTISGIGYQPNYDWIGYTPSGMPATIAK